MTYYACSGQNSRTKSLPAVLSDQVGEICRRICSSMQKQLLYFLRFVHKNSSSNQTTIFSWAQRWSVQIADVLMYFYFDLEPSLNEVLSWNILLLSRIHAAVNLHRALDLQLQNSSKASTPANRSSQWQLQFRCCILFRQLLLYCSDSKEPVVMKVALISWCWYLTTTRNQHNCADLKVWICALQSFFLPSPSSSLCRGTVLMSLISWKLSNCFRNILCPQLCLNVF